MTKTLKLAFGDTAIDLLAEPYNAIRADFVLPSLPDERVRKGLRLYEVGLYLRAANASGVETLLMGLSMTCDLARTQTLAGGNATRVRLLLQLETDGYVFGYNVAAGYVRLSSRALADADDRLLVTLELEVGNPTQDDIDAGLLPPPPTIVPGEKINRLPVAVDNYQSATASNYTDVPAVTGVPPTQIKIYPAAGWTGKADMFISRRVGDGLTDDLWLQGTEFGGVAATEGLPDIASGTGPASISFSNVSVPAATGPALTARRLRYTVSTTSFGLVPSGSGGIAHYGRFTFTLAGGSTLPAGRFRALIRGSVLRDFPGVFVGRFQGFALGWSSGDHTYAPNFGSVIALPSADSAQEFLDLGVVDLPAIGAPYEYSPADVELSVYAITKYSNAALEYGNRTYIADWFIDFLFLIPEGDGYLAVEGVDAAERVLVDNVATGGVYILDASDKVRRVVPKMGDSGYLAGSGYRGAPFGLAPAGTRIYVLRGDAAHPNTVRTNVEVTYWI